MKMRKKPNLTPEPTAPEIVRVATSIATTEKALQQNVTANVQTQMKLNAIITEEQKLRKQLTGLQREMDRHTSRS